MKRYEELYDVLNKELQPALGCTEPAAVTYACAVAAKALGVPAEKVEIAASKNILKNVMGVGIPNTDSYGITAAAATVRGTETNPPAARPTPAAVGAVCTTA